MFIAFVFLIQSFTIGIVIVLLNRYMSFARKPSIVPAAVSREHERLKNMDRILSISLDANGCFRVKTPRILSRNGAVNEEERDVIYAGLTAFLNNCFFSDECSLVVNAKTSGERLEKTKELGPKRKKSRIHYETKDVSRMKNAREEFETKIFKKKVISPQDRGKKRGNYIHRQLQYIHEYSIGIINKQPKLYINGLHPYTKEVLNLLNRFGLRMWLPEMAIYDEELGVATMVDLIAYDDKGKMFVIEYKTTTSKKRSFEKFDQESIGTVKNLKALIRPGGYIWKSPLHKAYLQAAFCVYMLKNFYEMQIECGCVIMVNDEGATMYECPKAYVDEIPRLRKYAITKKRERKHRTKTNSISTNSNRSVERNK